MKSIKNHISLILALVGILFAMQSFIITDRAIEAYANKLASSYALVVVASKQIETKKLQKKLPLIKGIVPLDVKKEIDKLQAGIEGANKHLLELSLPKFYKIVLKHYPTPEEIKQLKKELSKIASVKKVEDFQASYDNTYKLLLLVQDIVEVFASLTFVITTLLIAKELRIWQFNHHERMSIMGLFGAPKWLSSAVLFRLAIVDAVFAAIIIFIVFELLASSQWVASMLRSIGIQIVIFDVVSDFFLLLGSALGLSLLLAGAVVFFHKEEV